MKAPTWRVKIGGIAFAAPLCLGAAPIDRIVTLSLTPYAATSDRAAGLAVDELISGVEGPLELQLDSLSPGLDRSRDTVTDLTARDSRGALAFATPEVRDGGQHMIWTARRPVVGTVHLSYLMPSALSRPVRRGPHVDLQAIDGGVSGSFAGFLLAPAGPMHLSVRWHLPAGQRAVSSLGDGDVMTEGTLSDIDRVLFVAGPILTMPSSLPQRGFGLAALGRGALNLDAADRWYAKAFAVERDAFHAPADTRFRVLVRTYDGGPIASGRATKGAFLYYLPPHADAATLYHRATIAHELVHSLGNALDDEQGDAGDWYTEGIADYVSVTLPYRAGLYTPREYLDLVNQAAAAYYGNALRGTPNAGLDAVMWSGRNAWMLPYNRGMLYFVDLEAKLRARRAGVTVIDLVNEMSRRFRAGAPQTNATWRALLTEKLGAWAVADWQAMLAGTLLVPASDAFGPCFTREPVASGYFDLGFARPLAVRAGQTVDGVQPGGPADRAGLRNGDVIAADVDINPLAEAFHRSITITVRREGRPLAITYDPHRGTAPGWRWKPRSGNRNVSCKEGDGRESS